VRRRAGAAAIADLSSLAVIPHRLKKLITILSAAAVTCILLASFLVDRIPPRPMTATRMHVLKRRVLQFAQSHGELPKTLAVLPTMERDDSSIQDGWKRDIIFEVSNSGVVSFRSFGRDGVTGGSSEKADIVRSFPARDAQGKWSEELVEWTEDTFKR
jgi:hypothetical protein